YSYSPAREPHAAKRGRGTPSVLYVSECDQMSELKDKPLKPRVAVAESAGAGVVAEREPDAIDQDELRVEHRERQQHQHASIEGLDRETLLNMLYQMVL